MKWTWEANPGEVWEEEEFWIALSWAIDEDGTLGIREHFESPYRPGERVTIDEAYRWIFENSVPGLPEAAKKEDLSPLAYMRKYGAFEITRDDYTLFESETNTDGAQRNESGQWMKEGKVLAVEVEGKPRAGFATPSRKLEFFSPTMNEWGYEDHVLPDYIRSHVHPDNIDSSKNEYVLVPTFRIPTLIHTRSANSKWLYELSNSNPVWISPPDAARIGVKSGQLLRIVTHIGYYVNRAWVTEGIRPGVVACSHHLGRWRLENMPGTDRWAAADVELKETGKGRWRVRRTGDVAPFSSDDPDSQRIWWKDDGVHQNLTFPVQPDPVSGMHCWHQKVTVEKASSDDRYGDVEVDTNKAFEVYEKWLALSEAPASPPHNLRRPLWFARTVKPSLKAYRF